MVPLRLLKPVRIYAHATILAHPIGLPLRALQSGRLGMSWRAPGRCLSTPGCQLPTGPMPAVAFAIMRIHAWWKVIVLGIDATNRYIFKGEIIPFGALIDFRPPEPILNMFPTFEKRSLPGIFLGCHLMSGERFYGDYLVAPLVDFQEPPTGGGPNLPHR